jgi:hypothetical protein
MYKLNATDDDEVFQAIPVFILSLFFLFFFPCGASVTAVAYQVMLTMP